MALLRKLKDDFQEFPATMALGSLWVAVFIAMVVNQAVQAGSLTPTQLVLAVHNGHRFGDMTLRELYSGEIWRAVTATFIHYGLLHIGMNLWAFYQIGCLVESWYGPGPFLMIYVLTGGGGNLLSGFIRHTLKSDPGIASAGGSTVIMGLVGLCAVVGWRSRTRMGDHLRNQMLWVIALTAALGVGLELAGHHVIDNWGHAGGTIVGLAIAAFNRTILKFSASPFAKLSGWLAASLLVLCAAAQVNHDRTQDAGHSQLAEQARKRWASDERLILRLDEVRQLYKTLATPRAITRGSYVSHPPTTAKPPLPPTESKPAPKPSDPSSPAKPAETSAISRIDPEQELFLVVLNAAGRSLNSMSAELQSAGSSADFHRALQLLSQTLQEPPTLDEVREFDDHMHAMLHRIRKDRDLARMRSLTLSSRSRLD